MSRVRNFSDWAYWRLHLERVEPADPCPLHDLAQLDAWRRRVRARIDALFGPDPIPVPLDAEITESRDCGDYQWERVVFDTEAAMSVPALLLVPHGAVQGAIIAVHGHGSGKAAVCDPEGADAYAHQLARAGFLVCAPDLRGFGERADWMPDDKYHCDWNLVCATMAGVAPLARNIWDLRRTIDFVATHPQVNSMRIGMVGFSYGGTCTLFAAALDDRVRAACVSGYLSSWASAHRVPWNMCGSQVLPGMLGQLEHLDVAALVAPRPLFVESGVDDVIFPIETARETVDALQQVYSALAAPEALTHAEHSGGHEWNGDAVADFFGRHL